MPIAIFERSARSNKAETPTKALMRASLAQNNFCGCGVDCKARKHVLVLV